MVTSLPLSLFYQILVFIEDQGEATLPELETLGQKRQVLGALGRLEGLRYIERQKKVQREDDTIILSEKGDELLDTLLDHIPDPKSDWDGKWRMILFDIPETQRTVRQMFRLKLLDLGARMFQPSVWMSPHQRTIDQFSDIIEREGFSQAVNFFESTSVPPTHIDVSSLWQLDSVEDEYKSLFKTMERATKQLGRDPLASFKAKCFIVALALVSKKDPHLPEDLMPKNWLGKEVHTWHTTLRSFCNE